MAVVTTAQSLIKDALKLIGALAQGEEPTAGEFEDSWHRLNEMVDDWATQRLTQQTVLETTIDLVGNQASYTVGDGGDVDIARPEFVDDVWLLLTTTTPPCKSPLLRMTNKDWQALAMPTLTNSLPTSWYYQSTMPLGTLTLWPVPDNSTNDLLLYTPTAFLQFATQTTSYTLPPSYARALRTNLAVTLAPEFGRTLDPLILLQAQESLGNLKRLNAPMVDLSMDAALTAQQRNHGWDVYLGP